MPGNSPRIYVSFDQYTHEALEEISKVEHASKSHVVAKLVRYAIELAEDLALVQRAEKRLKTFRVDEALSTEELLRWNKSRKKRR